MHVEHYIESKNFIWNSICRAFFLTVRSNDLFFFSGECIKCEAGKDHIINQHKMYDKYGVYKYETGVQVLMPNVVKQKCLVVCLLDSFHLAQAILWALRTTNMAHCTTCNNNLMTCKPAFVTGVFRCSTTAAVLVVHDYNLYRATVLVNFNLIVEIATKPFCTRSVGKKIVAYVPRDLDIYIYKYMF